MTKFLAFIPPNRRPANRHCYFLPKLYDTHRQNGRQHIYCATIRPPLRLVAIEPRRGTAKLQAVTRQRSVRRGLKRPSADDPHRDHASLPAYGALHSFERNDARPSTELVCGERLCRRVQTFRVKFSARTLATSSDADRSANGRTAGLHLWITRSTLGPPPTCGPRTSPTFR
jgi:hypothetical protein